MTLTLKFFVILLALICFGVAALGIPTNRFGVGWLGLLLWLAADTFG